MVDPSPDPAPPPAGTGDTSGLAGAALSGESIPLPLKEKGVPKPPHAEP
jgi:hypothetical protein